MDKLKIMIFWYLLQQFQPCHDTSRRGGLDMAVTVIIMAMTMAMAMAMTMVINM